MKKVMFWVMLVILILSMGLSAQVEKKEFAVSPGKKLMVDLKGGGDIAISAWDQAKVEIAIDFQGKPRENWKVDFEQSDVGLRVVASFLDHRGHTSPHFSIRVPRQLDLELKTMGGAIAIDGVSGSIHGRTMGGKLNLKNLKGNLSMTTMGGDIELRDSEVEGTVSTMGGSVLIENVLGGIKGSSMGGNVIYRNVKGKAGNGNGQAVQIETMGGDINVEDAPMGARVQTMGGDIRIKRAGKFVKARTMGGNITIDAVDGSVAVTTMGGDINVNEIGPNVGEPKTIELSSMGGDLELFVPENFEMDIEIDIQLSQGHEGHGSISSDFSLEQKREKKDDHGKLREHLIGKGKTGSGKHRVILHTINGNVSLKKRK